MRTTKTLRDYQYKLAPQTPITPPKHLTHHSENKLREQLLINDFITRFKEQILKEHGLYTSQDVIWILKKYMESNPHISIITLLENFKEIRIKEYRKKFKIENEH